MPEHKNGTRRLAKLGIESTALAAVSDLESPTGVVATAGLQALS